jgi:hypothetical protein
MAVFLSSVRQVFVVVFVIVLGGVLISSCGSGPDKPSSAVVGNSNSTSLSNTKQFVEYSPSQSTLAAKKEMPSFGLDYTGSQLSLGQGCSEPVTNKIVYEQANSIVFGAAGVTEAEQQEVAEFAEAAVLEVKSRFPGTSMIGFFGKKIHVCVQPQAVSNRFSEVGVVSSGNVAAALSLITSAGGFVFVESASKFFMSPTIRSAIGFGYQRDFQAIYHRVMVHEMTHLFEQSRSPIALDQWFTEGMARFLEIGKPVLSVDEIVGLVSASNPIKVAWPNYDSRTSLSDYWPSAAVISYLFSSDGAGNPITAYTAMLDKLRVDSAAFIASCNVAGTLPFDCQPQNLEARRSAYFVAAFETAFKEKDGAPMRLRSGSNNLQDTIVARLKQFW